MDDLDSILASAREAYSPDPGAQKRVRRGLAITLGTATLTASTGAIESAAAQTTAANAAGSAAAGSSKLAASGGAAAATGSLGAKLGILLAVVGVSTAGYLALDDGQAENAIQPPIVAPGAVPAPRAKPVPPNTQAPEPPAETSRESQPPKQELAPSLNTAPEDKPSPATRTSRRRAPRASSGEPSSTLLAELNLLKRASGELRNGRPSLALQTLKEHRTQYPKSVLASERRGLSLLARCASAKTPGVILQARRFLKAAPSSPLAPHIKKQCLN
jgi:hypothetical protein